MNTTIRNYEVLYIVDPTLTDEQIEAIIAKYSTTITNQGAEVKAVGKWDKRRLAYEVMGRREGAYILMFFDGEAAVAKELDRVFRIADDVLRHLITRVEPEHVDTSRIDRPQPTPEPAVAVAVAVEAPAVEPAAEAAPTEETPAAEEAAPAVEETTEAPAEEQPATEETTSEEAPEEAAVETVEEPASEPAEASEEPASEESTKETGGEEPKAE